MQQCCMQQRVNSVRIKLKESNNSQTASQSVKAKQDLQNVEQMDCLCGGNDIFYHGI